MKRPGLFVLLASALVVGACSASDPGISTNVKTKLAADDLVKARDINVDTKDRVVTLTGVVQSTDEETRALQIARNTSGVSDVIDQISVAPVPQTSTAPTTGTDTTPGTPGAAIVGDAGITTAVKAKLLADPAVGGLQINVDTTDRVVTLSGSVATQAEKDRAVELARQIDAVTRVEDKLTVKVK